MNRRRVFGRSLGFAAGAVCCLVLTVAVAPSLSSQEKSMPPMKEPPADIFPKVPAHAMWDIGLLLESVQIHKWHYDKDYRVIVWTCTSMVKAGGGLDSSFDEKHYPNAGFGVWMVKYLDEDDVEIAKERIYQQPSRLVKGEKCRILHKLREDDILKKTKKFMVVPHK
jgi:hypothetical protein